MQEMTGRLRRELEELVRRGRTIVEQADDATLYRRPTEGSWSAAECLEHLSVTTEKYVRRVRRALDEAAEKRPAGKREKHSLVGRLFLRIMEPPVKKKLPAPKGFAPESAAPREALVSRFATAHAQLIALVEESDAFDRTRLKVASPASKFVKLSLLDAFAILAGHGRRHLWQAERAIGRV